MLIGLLSDTHDRLDAMIAAMRLLRGAGPATSFMAEMSAEKRFSMPLPAIRQRLSGETMTGIASHFLVTRYPSVCNASTNLASSPSKANASPSPTATIPTV